MGSFRTIGEEIRSNLQLVVVLISYPLIIQYVIWKYLPALNNVQSSSEITSMRPVEYLQNSLSDNAFFVKVLSSQVEALVDTISKLHLAAFVLGGLLAAFLIAEPVYRGSIINDIAVLGRRMSLAGRLLFMLIYGVFLVFLTVVTFKETADVLGIPVDFRLLVALFIALTLSVVSGFFLVGFISLISKEPVIPLGILFLVSLLSRATDTLNRLLLPFEKITYFLADSKMVNLNSTLYAGVVLYAFLILFTVEAFEGGDFY